MSTSAHPIASAVGAAAEFNPKEPFVGLYLMHYRNGISGNHILTKNFRFNGSLREARERAEKHCQTMGFKLMFVEPLICDLTKEEQLHVGDTIKIEGEYR